MTAPAHAILVWADDKNIYCAPQTQPHMGITYPRNEGGLHKALAMLIDKYVEAGCPTYERPQITPPALVKSNLTLEDLAAASKALRELGIIK